MDSQHTAVTHYAILIGIDAYPDKPLRSCVRDVQDIKTYLETALDSVLIQMFTATDGTYLGLSGPVEDPMLWPTHYNVTSALEKITSLARAGDFVYIHYSGHGTRKPPDGELSNGSTRHLALALLHRGKENYVRYFWGSELAFSLKAMVDKGLVVTLVLDCCFSASVYRRDDPSIRFLPYDPEIESNFPADPDKSLEDGCCGPASRDASMLPNWLINPDGYAILCACGPHEVAMEPKFDGQRHGALSYFLFRTLVECSGLAKMHKDISNHLRAKFRKSQLPQNPVCYGNKSQVFFGHAISENIAVMIPIIEKQDGSLELQAGQAHGICDGDQFALHSFCSIESDLRSQKDLVLAKVAHVGALTSILELLDITSSRVRTGWIARALTRFSLRKFPIRLDISLPYRDEWLTALKERSLDVYNNTDKRSISFHIVLNSSKEYEILDGTDQKILYLPAIMQDQTDASEICEIMEHLARYKLVRDLANNVPADPFRETFDVYIVNGEETFRPPCLVEIEHDEVKSEFVVENKGNEELYLYVYDMGPCWQIENILKGSYEVIPPQNTGQRFTGMFRKKLKTVVPPEMKGKGLRQCDDIIKVFVTSQPTSFDLVELPKLGELAKRKLEPTSKTGRGGLNHWLGDWAALNFPIHTSLK